jgi:hypothetical protein
MTTQLYVQYLIATIRNYTCTNLSEHLEPEPGTSHDAISDFLSREKLTPRGLWELVGGLIENGVDAFLILDDSVQNKEYSKVIELVKLQYSGAVHGLVRGIGVVNLVHSTGHEGDYFPVDYRIYDDKTDGKSKNVHSREMLIRAVSDKGIKARTILFDSWYASVENLKLIHRMGRYFITTLKSNRKVSLSKESGYVNLEDIVWTQDQLTYGIVIKLKGFPYFVRLFKIVATNGDIEWLVTNKGVSNESDSNEGASNDPGGDNSSPITADGVQKENSVRWDIERMHRELKQLTGTERCQCRKARAQRNHIACCYWAWLSIKLTAIRDGDTIYTAHANLLRNYLKQELRNPRINAYTG